MIPSQRCCGRRSVDRVHQSVHPHQNFIMQPDDESCVEFSSGKPHDQLDHFVARTGLAKTCKCSFV